MSGDLRTRRSASLREASCTYPRGEAETARPDLPKPPDRVEKREIDLAKTVPRNMGDMYLLICFGSCDTLL